MFMMFLAPAALSVIAALEWGLVMLTPNPFIVGCAVFTTGMFFITLATYNRYGR